MQNETDRENNGSGVSTSASNFFGLIRIYNCDFETMMILRWILLYIRFVVIEKIAPLKNSGNYKDMPYRLTMQL